jgi:hypothetical protein
MLTEIEWWGGLLFIWLALVYYLIHKDGEWDSKLELVTVNITYICAAVVLALFFYALNTPTMKYVYIGALGLGIPLSILLLFLQGNESSDSETPDNEEAEEDDEEDGSEHVIAGHVLLYTPIVIAFGLGIYKAREFTDILPFLS